MSPIIRWMVMWGPLALSVKNWVVDVTPVSGLCLQPTSRPGEVSSGDWVLVEKYGVRVLGKVNRGDAVLLRSPEEPNSHWVRRLTGLEGDWVSRADKRDAVHVRRVPKGHCWVEMECEESVSDKYRACAVPVGLLEGRMSCIIWPPSRAGKVESLTCLSDNDKN